MLRLRRISNKIFKLKFIATIQHELLLRKLLTKRNYRTEILKNETKSITKESNGPIMALPTDQVKLTILIYHGSLIPTTWPVFVVLFC